VDVKTRLVDDADLIAAADAFEENFLPGLRLMFGKEKSQGIDGDPRIHILLTEGGDSWQGFFGYFGSRNQLPAVIKEFSNEREMLVINISAFLPSSETFVGKLAHEYQHLAQWNQDPNEDLWLNEMFRELAYFLTGAPIVTPGGEECRSDQCMVLCRQPLHPAHGQAGSVHGRV
jgi:hypothetical protein